MRRAGYLVFVQLVQRVLRFLSHREVLMRSGRGKSLAADNDKAKLNYVSLVDDVSELTSE